MMQDPNVSTALMLRLQAKLPNFFERLNGLLSLTGVIPEVGLSQCLLRLRDLEYLCTGIDLALLLPELAGLALRRQLSFIAGRLCAEKALQMVTGKWSAINMNGMGAPQWPTGCRGSITHDAERAIAIVSPARLHTYVGVDVECIATADELVAIADMCLTQSEQQLLAGTTQLDIEATLRFSAKESYYKAVYPSVVRWIDYVEVEVVNVDWTVGHFTMLPISMSSVALPLPVLQGNMCMLDNKSLITWILV